MDRRIIALIVFLLVGFLAAEGSALAAKEGGIRKVLFNYYQERYIKNVKENGNKPGVVRNSNGVGEDNIILVMSDPPIPPPPWPDPD